MHSQICALCLLGKRSVTSFLRAFDSIIRRVRCLSDDQRFSAAIIPLITLARSEFVSQSPLQFTARCQSKRLIAVRTFARLAAAVKTPDAESVYLFVLLFATGAIRDFIHDVPSKSVTYHYQAHYRLARSS